MAGKFLGVAKKIVQKSIKSVIYIDDSIAVPYDSKANPAQLSFSKSLYETFKKEKVSIDFYKYSSKKNWKEYLEFLFRNRDLLILDWQLDIAPPQKNTLEILTEAINTKSLHFSCIYTKTEQSELGDVIYSIKAYFSKWNTNAKTIFNDFYSYIDNQGHEGINNELDTLKGRFKDFSLELEREEKKKILIEIQNTLSLKLGGLYTEFQTTLYNVSPDINAAYETLGFIVNQEHLRSDVSGEFEMNTSFYKDNFIIVNHTIIFISNKNNHKPTELYKKFCDAVINSSGNFLTLMSLEIRNLFRESSAFIGKDIDSINELAFFFHKNQIKPEEAFFDFLIELWKGQATAFLYEKGKTLNIFDKATLADYTKQRKIDKGLKKIEKERKRKKKPIEITKELAKLNYYYNIMNIERNLEDMLRFGDIFCILNNSRKPTNDFLLCVTAHCDCLHPDNIKNLFYFVKGSKTDLESALVEGDTGFNSFIASNKGEIIAIKWKNKPFTIPVSNSKILAADYEASVGENKLFIRYTTTLKENYTQRIANNAFTYPFHVGIFFADLKE